MTLDTEAVPRYNENILWKTRKGGKHGGKSGVDLRGEAGQSADRHSRRAFLGALIGTALWVLVGVWGYVASIVAWLTAFLAGKGYDLLHGRPGKAKAITIIVMLILSICVGTVGTVAVVGVQSIKEAEEEMNSFELAHFKKLYPNELDYVLEMMQTNDEIHTEITKSLALGMLFGALGAYPIVLGDRRKKQRQDTVQPYEAADGAPKSTENADDTDKHLDA